MSIGRITVKHTRSPLCDIRQMSKQHALGSFVHRLSERRSAAQRVDEILEMIQIHIAARGYRVGGIRYDFGLDFFHQLILVIEDLIIPTAQVDERTTVSIDDKSAVTAFHRVMVTAATLPGNGLAFRKFETVDLRIGRLPVVLKSITTTRGNYFGSIVETQEPPAAVDLVRTVVTGFTRPPMPEPVPVIRNHVVLVIPAGRRPLP